MFGKSLKILFYAYVIALAGYTTFKQLGHQRLGRLEEKIQTPEPECEQGGEKWRYCVYTTSSADSNTYLYLFHGRGETEKLWSDPSEYTAQLQSFWQSQGIVAPKVIAVSLGPTWLITPRMSHPATGLLELFRDEIFPKIEGKLGRPKRRYLLGASMGGLNALALSFHFPRQFHRVAVLCPPLSDVSPQAPLLEVFAFGVANGMKIKSLLEFLYVGRSLIQSEDEWERISPLHLARRNSLAHFPPIYLSSGFRDEYGNFPAVRQLAELLQARAPEVQWHPSSGGHCAVDIPSLAHFLTQRK